jgi:hypothetical protein
MKMQAADPLYPQTRPEDTSPGRPEPIVAEESEKTERDEGAEGEKMEGDDEVKQEAEEVTTRLSGSIAYGELKDTEGGT